MADAAPRPAAALWGIAAAARVADTAAAARAGDGAGREARRDGRGRGLQQVIRAEVRRAAEQAPARLGAFQQRNMSAQTVRKTDQSSLKVISGPAK